MGGRRGAAMAVPLLEPRRVGSIIVVAGAAGPRLAIDPSKKGGIEKRGLIEKSSGFLRKSKSSAKTCCQP